MFGHFDCVTLLLEAGAACDRENSHCKTPYHLAAEHGHLKMVPWLRAGKFLVAILRGFVFVWPYSLTSYTVYGQLWSLALPFFNVFWGCSWMFFIMVPMFFSIETLGKIVKQHLEKTIPLGSNYLLRRYRKPSKITPNVPTFLVLVEVDP